MLCLYSPSTPPRTCTYSLAHTHTVTYSALQVQVRPLGTTSETEGWHKGSSAQDPRPTCGAPARVALVSDGNAAPRVLMLCIGARSPHWVPTSRHRLVRWSSAGYPLPTRQVTQLALRGCSCGLAAVAPPQQTGGATPRQQGPSEPPLSLAAKLPKCTRRSPARHEGP